MKMLLFSYYMSLLLLYHYEWNVFCTGLIDYIVLFIMLLT